MSRSRTVVDMRRHDVVYRVSAWGHVFRVFSPCELMPKKLGCASLGACACQVAHVRALLQGAALPNHAKPWFDPWSINSMRSRCTRRANTFIANVQANAREIIDSQLYRHHRGWLDSVYA